MSFNISDLIEIKINKYCNVLVSVTQALGEVGFLRFGVIWVFCSMLISYSKRKKICVDDD